MGYNRGMKIFGWIIAGIVVYVFLGIPLVSLSIYFWVCLIRGDPMFGVVIFTW